MIEGKVYRTKEIDESFRDRLTSLGLGLWYLPKISRFGPVPPTDEALLEGLLRSPFVITGPSRWNSLGLGTTAMFAVPLVYNRKRSGEICLGGRRFLLRRVRFPDQPPVEWFVVDLLNHAEQAGADAKDLVKVLREHEGFDREVLREMVASFGSRRTRSLPLT